MIRRPGKDRVGLSDAYAEKGSNGSKRLDQVGGLYKRLTPAILELLEFREILDTLKNISHPKSKLITSLGLAHAL